MLAVRWCVAERFIILTAIGGCCTTPERGCVNRAWNVEKMGVVSDVLFGGKDTMNYSAQRHPVCVSCVEVVCNASFGVKGAMTSSEKSFVSDAGRLTCH